MNYGCLRAAGPYRGRSDEAICASGASRLTHGATASREDRVPSVVILHSSQHPGGVGRGMICQHLSSGIRIDPSLAYNLSYKW
jgi:hypothetical protein